MDPKATAEMRAALAQTGIKQTEIAQALGMHDHQVSRALNNKIPLPETFAERFWAYVRPKAEAMARQMIEDAERQARLLRDAVSVPDLTEAA